MTDYFEVHERDAAARLGELRLAESVTTPAIVDDVEADTPGAVHTLLRDGGSLWAQDGSDPEGDDSAVTVLPYRGLPAGTPDEVADAFAGDYPDVDFPSAAVVSPRTAGQHTGDVTVLSGAPGYVGHGEAFVDAITAVREATPSDTALYLPGVATPRNVATLVYAGVDLVDPDRAVVRGTEGRYLTTDEAYFLEDLEELPCACPACQVPRDEFDREACVAHNVNALAAELRRVRRRIRDGRLRDYVEGQARQDNWLTATVRLLDQQYGYVEQRTPLIRRAQLSAATEDAIRRVEIQRFAERVTERYVPRFDDRPLVLVPCSARKPYSDSQSHEQYHDAVHWRAHMVSMTSPIGVVPQELELTYPAQHYDSVVTGEWSANEVEFVSAVLERYLEDADYPEIIAHVPGEGYRDICERVEESLGLEFSYTVSDHPTTADSLGNLAAELEGWDTYRKSTREANTVRAVADYQFGEGAGDSLFDDIQTTGRYPQLRADTQDGEQLAALAQQYGVLSLTLAGARRWVESDVPTKTVEIEPFVPHGSVLAPGITDASDDIRVGDDVVVRGDAAFGVGRAQMSGPEMRDSTRGIAVQMRHVEEQ
ncbi:archaeosine synthase subunit alpha [Halomicroarcula sp. GCM10025817]|uniref:archaeosine synthase subunit alpha n=1 Tax=Haloarcula TaxID=2237 RepID=UPI0023E80788|nr:archaeosine synthase subunit alpha [Halomicroarcula sp. SYNS111]